MNKMNNLLFLLSLYRLLQPIIVSAQSTAIVFQTTMAPTQCACYSGIVCPSGTTGGADVRIVNNGTTCPTGFVYCCSSGVSSNIGINAATCGRVYVSPTAQPTGQASFGEFPWQVLLYASPSPNNYVGGGALITSLHVLTATHKITCYLNGGLVARLGEWNFQVTTEPYPFIDIPVLPNPAVYNPFNANNLQNDITVLRLRDPAPIGPPNNPHINTVCLTSGLPAAGTRCRVAGWGKDSFNGQYPSTLKMVDVPVKSSADCQTDLRKTALGANFVLDGSFMCAGGEAGKDACTGDGGSALVCPTGSGAYQAVGLVSWGMKCADGGVPGVYTNINNFDTWVKSQATV